ncbi:glycoside hydrolase family 108 protein [Roseomonas mucosa]|uniref:glycoside hydrolase family 108 protein n=1 Tax=Roseomonas mucosa TaxID=207340 RepID=UPI002246DDE4|nr:glycosyl hydrolase 108 family protein [Roseomonas mucosa]UZO91788.1 putative membrane associated protein [Roseomonas mucosa]
MPLRSILLGAAALIRLVPVFLPADGAAKAVAPDSVWVTVPRVIEGVANEFTPMGLVQLPPVSTWSACITEVLQSEGGFVNHPADPGGATNRGVTLARLSEWRGKACTVADVKALQEQEAREIYRAGYWNPIQGDALPAGLALALMDFAVNSGIKRAVKTLQACMGFAAADCDGVMGPQTLRAVLRRSAADLMNALCDARLKFLRALTTFATFGRGWTARVERVRGVALRQMAVV